MPLPFLRQVLTIQPVILHLVFFFINDACVCNSATQTFSRIAFSLADNCDGLELEVEFDFEDLVPEDFELFSEDFDFLSNFNNNSASFNQMWILC